MVELEVWYDQDAENDYGSGDPAYVVSTVGELNALVDRVLVETRDHRCPAMIQVNVHGQRLPVLEVGLGRERGFIVYHAEDGGSTKGDGDPLARVEYVYMGSLSETSADVEVGLHDVRHGLMEFMETGQRPSVIHD
ncbi:Imm1 family immunity protein [Alloactinosynnema sp. L-07]|uniref:Imm1 family immunity protein n=1 Tax=Alloactinosynnema sp. L-07 TaxID=1653480 RepID=UPI0009EEA293|nr:Imm1 family immunity protein [Alloactinosynnema sp. L-07]